jgi:hypothetical protein
MQEAQLAMVSVEERAAPQTQSVFDRRDTASDCSKLTSYISAITDVENSLDSTIASIQSVDLSAVTNPATKTTIQTFLADLENTLRSIKTDLAKTKQTYQSSYDDKNCSSLTSSTVSTLTVPTVSSLTQTTPSTTSTATVPTVSSSTQTSPSTTTTQLAPTGASEPMSTTSPGPSTATVAKSTTPFTLTTTSAGIVMTARKLTSTQTQSFVFERGSRHGIDWA